MPDIPTPRSTVDMDLNFEKRIREVQDQAQVEYDSRKVGNQVRWYRPVGWTGDAFDVEAISPPFARDASNDAGLQALQDQAHPGTTGDIVAATTMIDGLACMERALRTRHTLRRPRGVAHMLGRKRGQGSNQGPLVQNYLEYVRAILKEAKSR